MWKNGGNIDWCIGDFDGCWCGRRITFGIPHCESEFKDLPIHENSIQIDVRLTMRGIYTTWKIFHPNHVTAIVFKINYFIIRINQQLEKIRKWNGSEGEIWLWFVEKWAKCYKSHKPLKKP